MFKWPSERRMDLAVEEVTAFLAQKGVPLDDELIQLATHLRHVAFQQYRNTYAVMGTRFLLEGVLEARRLRTPAVSENTKKLQRRAAELEVELRKTEERLPEAAVVGDVTDAMVESYLKAQRESCEGQERHGGTGIGSIDSRKACRAGLEAAFACNSQPAGDPCTAAIQFALEADDGLNFLYYWNEGDFDVIREEWPDAPGAVFIGADSLYKPPCDQGAKP